MVTRNLDLCKEKLGAISASISFRLLYVWRYSQVNLPANIAPGQFSRSSKYHIRHVTWLLKEKIQIILGWEEIWISSFIIILAQSHLTFWLFFSISMKHKVLFWVLLILWNQTLICVHYFIFSICWHFINSRHHKGDVIVNGDKF